MKIDIEEIEALQARRAEINSLKLKDLEFYKDGKKLDIPSEYIENFEFTGLATIDFIARGYYSGLGRDLQIFLKKKL